MFDLSTSANGHPALLALAASLPRWLRRLEPVLRGDYWEDVFWATVAGIGAFVFGRLVAYVLIRLTGRWARMTATPVDDMVVRHLADPIRWLLPLFFVSHALSAVDLSDSAQERMNQVLVVGTILTVGWLLFRVVHVLEEVLRTRFVKDGSVRADSSANYTQLQAFRNIAGFVIAVVSVGLALLSFAGVRQIGTSVLASAGVVGVVVGFAAQRSIATILAGLVIAIAQPIRIGDVVQIEGESGTVEEITLTYVVVRLGDLRRLILPVNQFLEKPFQNWSRTSTQLVGSVLLYLDYTVPIGVVREEFQRLLEASPRWDRGSFSLQVVDSTDRTLVVRAQMSAADPASAWDLRCEIREGLVAFIQAEHPGALPRLRNIEVA